ncbi:MAG: hypothetical protein J6S23_04190 [Clostridia bacterium]|nr:hypothetical protein [Clostridia bacterium]
MGINYEPIENTCGCTQCAGDKIIEFDGKMLCEECFLDEIWDLIKHRDVEILAQLVGSECYEVE